MTFGTFFLPGPTEVRPDVLEAMVQPMISHRGPQFEALFADAQRGLQTVFGTTRPVLISTSSATGLMEAAVRCAPAGRILSLVNGAFSERFAHIAEACGRNVDRYVVEWGQAHRPEVVAEWLAKTSYAAVTVAHSETSSGVLNPVQAISDAAHDAGAMCLIDSVSALCGAELRFDDWQLDYVLTGSQKAFALPPGLAFAVTSEAYLQHAAQADRKGVYFDIVELTDSVRKGQAPNTPAISLYYALVRQLDSILTEGMVGRWARHAAMAAHVQAWVARVRDSLGVDIRILADEGVRSPTVTTIMLPDGWSSATVLDAVAARGFTVGTGYGKLKDQSIRIGHMGDHSVETVFRCLVVCEDVLRELQRADV